MLFVFVSLSDGVSTLQYQILAAASGRKAVEYVFYSLYIYCMWFSYQDIIKVEKLKLFSK